MNEHDDDQAEPRPWWARLLDLTPNEVAQLRAMLPWWMWVYLALLVALTVYLAAIGWP